MKGFPFLENKVSKSVVIREFLDSVRQKELVWHQDKEDRYVRVIKSNGWLLQLDNELPVVLEEGREYFIPKYTFHRVIKGTQSLIIEIKKVL